MNNDKKNPFAAFHIRQMVGLLIFSFLLQFIAGFLGSAMIRYAVWAFFVVLWVIGFMGALNGQEKPVPVLGEQFQQWFKGIG